MFRLLAFLALSAHGASGQDPSGTYLQGGLAGIPGAGIQAGFVSAEDFFTREINVVTDLRSFSSEGIIHVAATVGGSVRLYGIGRTIGSVDYRGFDLDLGARVGPSLSFRLRKEDHAFRNRRFSLFLEPFLRASVARWGRILYAEAGIHSPVVRIGLWWPLGARSNRVSP